MNKYTYKPPAPKKALLEAYHEEGLTQNECAQRFNVSQKRIFTAMKHYGIKARPAIKRDQRGPKNDNWKGDDAGKQAFHRRLYSAYGKPTQCALCETADETKSYDYANLTGRYHDITDYVPMCRSCHWIYDDKIKNIHHMKARLEGGSHA